MYVAGGHSYGSGKVGGSVHLAGGDSFAEHSIGGAITLPSGIGRNSTGDVAIVSADAPVSMRPYLLPRAGVATFPFGPVRPPRPAAATAILVPSQ